MNSQEKLFSTKTTYSFIFLINRDDVYPRKIEPKGNYAVYIAWSF
jgi:hypothetical protein